MDRDLDTAQLRGQLRLTWILMVLVIGVLVVPRIVSMIRWGEIAGEPRAVTPRGELADFEKTTTAIFQNSSPSVVYLTTRSRVASPFARRAIEVEAGSGSGFMWDNQGHIVTNFHVLQEASSARVVLWDQSSYEASLVGGSPDHDLAVLRIAAPPEKLRPVPIGESDSLMVGQSVFAIGNPFGLNQTLTTGVVSAKSRTIESPTGRSIEGVIQIDAAINPGNSGGPLLDSAGRLIGVNTAIYSPSGASAGVGFTIPVDTVNRVVPQIIAKGRYEPPQMGIRVNSEISDAVTSRLGVKGVLLLDVADNGGAAAAGLQGTVIGRSSVVQIGDILQAIDGQPISNLNEMLSTLEKYSPGDSVKIDYLRDSKTETATVTLR
ncbi:MAG: trypsin-like peptidase domain-containing protein [Planctomycetales bacterium]|nr:trypsin-like peptidase domain-containing protein [Planctomycetales bacterium]